MQVCTRTLLRLRTFDRYSPVASLRDRRQIIRRIMSSYAFQREYIRGDVFFLDEFADRQWDDPDFSGTRFSCDKKEFVDRVHQAAQEQGGAGLVDGYAPFCKHVFIPNEYDDVTVSAVEITDENRRLLETTYARRRPEEFAVLTRYFPADKVTAPRAAWLDVILYSREQLVKEHAALYGVSAEEVDAALPKAVPWGIISIKAQSESFETPMNPITMMRNALGKAEGGSGVPLVRAEYDKAVEYWSSHAMIQ
jgi:hypothetical protein